MHAHYARIHWAAGHPVRIVQLLMSLMKSVDYAICVSCMEDMQCKSKIVSPILKRFKTHIRGFLCSNCNYSKCDQWENTYIGLIRKNPKWEFGLFLGDWYLRGFKWFWEEESGPYFYCWNNKRIWFLRHRCDDNGYDDYRPTNFNLAVTESYSPFESTVCNIASNKQIETREFYNMNKKVSLTSQRDKIRAKLHCNVENVTLTLHIKINIQWIHMTCHHWLFSTGTYT